MNHKKNKGQAMILTILAIGGTILSATTIAGLLVVYQIRQSSDLTNSSKAIFGADTGLEWSLYQFFHPTSTIQSPSFSNGVKFTANCYDASGVMVQCADASAQTMRSVGEFGNVKRAFELSL